jgi:glycine C-acetyltransferase
MYGKIKDILKKEIKEIKKAGLYKSERIITSSQDTVIKISTGEEVLNFCANNYLGLSNHPAVIQAAKDTLDSHGFGMASVRFICGTQDIHKKLEKKIAEFYMQLVLMQMGVYLSHY